MIFGSVTRVSRPKDDVVEGRHSDFALAPPLAILNQINMPSMQPTDMDPVDQRLRVLIVEDDVLIARLIESHLLEAGHQIAGIEFSGERALDKVHSQKPDLVLLDINLEGTMDGIEVAEKIRDKNEVPFLFLTALSDVETLNRAKQVEPCGYIVKPYKATDLHSSIAIGMHNFNSRRMPDKKLTIDRVNRLALDPITTREFQLIVDISNGLTNAQICKKEHLSLSTVKWHLQNIYSKLGVKNRTSAVKLVLE